VQNIAYVYDCKAYLDERDSVFFFNRLMREERFFFKDACRPIESLRAKKFFYITTDGERQVAVTLTKTNHRHEVSTTRLSNLYFAKMTVASLHDYHLLNYDLDALMHAYQAELPAMVDEYKREGVHFDNYEKIRHVTKQNLTKLRGVDCVAYGSEYAKQCQGRSQPLPYATRYHFVVEVEKNFGSMERFTKAIKTFNKIDDDEFIDEDLLLEFPTAADVAACPRLANVAPQLFGCNPRNVVHDLHNEQQSRGLDLLQQRNCGKYFPNLKLFTVGDEQLLLPCLYKKRRERPSIPVELEELLRDIDKKVSAAYILTIGKPLAVGKFGACEDFVRTFATARVSDRIYRIGVSVRQFVDIAQRYLNAGDDFARVAESVPTANWPARALLFTQMCHVNFLFVENYQYANCHYVRPAVPLDLPYEGDVYVVVKVIPAGVLEVYFVHGGDHMFKIPLGRYKEFCEKKWATMN